jgi:hypothetical protein
LSFSAARFLSSCAFAAAALGSSSAPRSWSSEAASSASSAFGSFFGSVSRRSCANASFAVRIDGRVAISTGSTS